jgi:hypothetical protein
LVTVSDWGQQMKVSDSDCDGVGRQAIGRIRTLSETSHPFKSQAQRRKLAQLLSKENLE